MADYQYVSRGEVGTFDYAPNDLTLDGSWNDLDLSSIITGSDAVLVHLRVIVMDDDYTDRKLRFRRKGNTGNCCNTVRRTHEAGTGREGDVRVMTDDNQKIQYWGHSTLDEAYIVVRGWWTSPLYPGGEPALTDEVKDYFNLPYMRHTGAYSSDQGETYVVFCGGDEKSGKCPCDLYIVAYTHSTAAWGTPVKLIDCPAADAHAVPTILVDGSKYLHVFLSSHGEQSDTSLKHRRSKYALDSESWDLDQWDSADDLEDGATYHDSMIDSSDDLRVWYRQTQYNEELGDPNAQDIYREPLVVLKSTDDGATWGSPTARIYPDSYQESNWYTVYSTHFLYDSGSPAGVHIVWHVTKSHASKMRRHYYAFYKFSDMHVYNAAGTDYGSAATADEFSNFEVWDDGGEKDLNLRGIVALDSNGDPNIFAMKFYSGEYKTYWYKWNSSTNQWDENRLTAFDPSDELGDVMYASIDASDNITLYIRHFRKVDNDWWGGAVTEEEWQYNGSSWSRQEIFFRSDPADPKALYPEEVYNAQSDLQRLFKGHNKAASWSSPKEEGELFARDSDGNWVT